MSTVLEVPSQHWMRNNFTAAEQIQVHAVAGQVVNFISEVAKIIDAFASVAVLAFIQAESDHER